VPVSELPPLERFMLHRLDVMSKELTAAYDELNFAKVQTLLMQLSTSDLSAFYFDVIKDRLYVFSVFPVKTVDKVKKK
jgi:isoleucyl-tRNA synthetase